MKFLLFSLGLAMGCSSSGMSGAPGDAGEDFQGIPPDGGAVVVGGRATPSLGMPSLVASVDMSPGLRAAQPDAGGGLLLRDMGTGSQFSSDAVSVSPDTNPVGTVSLDMGSQGVVPDASTFVARPDASLPPILVPRDTAPVMTSKNSTKEVSPGIFEIFDERNNPCVYFTGIRFGTRGAAWYQDFEGTRYFFIRYGCVVPGSFVSIQDVHPMCATKSSFDVASEYKEFTLGKPYVIFEVLPGGKSCGAFPKVCSEGRCR